MAGTGSSRRRCSCDGRVVGHSLISATTAEMMVMGALIVVSMRGAYIRRWRFLFQLQFQLQFQTQSQSRSRAPVRSHWDPATSTCPVRVVVVLEVVMSPRQAVWLRSRSRYRPGPRLRLQSRSRVRTKVKQSQQCCLVGTPWAGRRVCRQGPESRRCWRSGEEGRPRASRVESSQTEPSRWVDLSLKTTSRVGSSRRNGDRFAGEQRTAD